MQTPVNMNYGWQSSRVPQCQSFLYARLAEVIQNTGARRVLDIGCGNGHLCGILASRGMTVTGIEPDPNGVRIARDNYPDVTFLNTTVADAQSVIPAGGFELAVSSEVLEHLYDPSELPRLAHHALASNGILLLTTPYHGYLKNLVISLCNGWDKHHNPLRTGGHIKFWSARTIRSLLEQNLFSVLSVRGAGRLPLFWMTMMVTARRLDPRPQEKTGNATSDD